jgi:lipopolysaccharide export LptBFGC system permease protein LptF
MYSTNSSSKSESILGNKILPFLIILSLLLLLLLILVCLFIAKYSRKKPRKIQRQGVIIKKHPQSKTDDPNSTLLDEYPEKTINNIRCIGEMFISDQKKPSISSDTPRHSTISMTKNAVNEMNDTDDLSDLDFTNIPRRHLRPSNPNLNDQSLVQTTKRSSYSSSENLYLNEYKERAAALKHHCNHRISIGSKTSEESSL